MEQDFSDEMKAIETVKLFETNNFKSSNKINKKYDASKPIVHTDLKNTQTNSINNPVLKEVTSPNISAIMNNNNTFNPPSAILAAAGINAAGMLSTTHTIGNLNNNNISNKSNSGDRNNIKPLDFCYLDVTNNKFAMTDAINLCVTVIAYATHANRAYQMLVVLDTIIPQYMDYLKNESDLVESIVTTKKEYDHISKISLALKTMINSVDIITRSFYSRTESLNNSYKNSNSYSHRSSSILPDEDSIR